MLIDPSEVSAEALRGIAENHVVTYLNEAQADFEFERWVEQTLRQIRSGELLVEYSEFHESIRLLTKDSLRSNDQAGDKAD